MIKNFSDLLQEFIKKEMEILDAQKISHPPTIGKMYEGLTHDLLLKSIPTEWDLRVTDGFIINNQKEMSKQIDCMLVIGEGTKIPYTDHYVYHISNVLAVLEIKKNLYSKELIEAFENLQRIHEIVEPRLINPEQFWDAYTSIIGEPPPDYDELSTLPVWKQEIYRAILYEAYLPIRIVIGYHGYSSEFNFRKAFIEHLEKNVYKDGYGPNSIPNLMISNNYSILKLNGMPHASQLFNENEWKLLGSFSRNPLFLLLELLWTKLTYTFNFPLSGFSDDLTIENLKLLLSAKSVWNKDRIGWVYGIFEFSDEELSSVTPFTSWAPINIDTIQASLLLTLIQKDEIDTRSDDFISYTVDPNFSDSTLATLVNSRLIYIDNEKIRLLTKKCAVLSMPDGSLIAGDNNSGRLTRWIENNTKS